MKSTLSLMAILLSTLYCFSQEPADALRYSWYTQSGTARQQAVGGAMGSLGGDISATFVNPAGLGLYRTGDFVLTPGYNLLSNKATYFGRTERDKKNYFNLGTSGFVIDGGGNTNKWHAFSIAVNRTANFGSNILYRGATNQSSYSQKFLEEIRNGNIKDANIVAENYPFGTSLAFNTFWIDTVGGGTNGNFDFQSRAAKLLSTGLLQQNIIESKGGITEIALAAAANFNNRFLIGGTLGIPLLNYKRHGVFTEADATTNPDNKFDYATLEDDLSTKGGGFNLRLGFIYKASDVLRLGLAIHSPTYYSLTDKYTATVTTNTESYQGTLTQSSTLFTNNAPSNFQYSLWTPYRVIGSVSYVLREVQDVTKQKGFLTADVEYVNYKFPSFSSGGNSMDQSAKDYLKSLNQAIDKAYKGAFNFRAGGEVKFTTVMARLGLAYYGNPYQNINGEKGSRLHLSGGLGYRNKGMFVDLAYIYTIAKDVNFPYRLQYSAYSGANIKGSASNILLTLGFKI
ncbi:MAG TPA: aromatic hydrocarbon degradation protein [Chitinophagaceae bacterium]|nr:aromatic hydrocarbon degradation protein [Chitinophagaceae bacterium]